MLSLKNISKKYNGNDVLKDVNLSFREKEFVAILGPSGCGKSTLLNIMSALEIPDEGELLLGNNNILSFKTKQLDNYRANFISYIFQSYNLINHINVLDNITLSSKLKNKKTSKCIVRKFLKKLDILSLEKYKITKLSGGEKQRVAITRSLVSDSPIILADEPTGALDTTNSHEVMRILKDISKEKLVIMVTHNEGLAKKYATRIIRLKDGQIQSDSKPYEKTIKTDFHKNKIKLKTTTAFKLSFNNLKNKKLRTFLTIIAFSIGLISLGLVLSISNGFSNEIQAFEQESLYNYPLIISREAFNPEITLNSGMEYQQGTINIRKSNMITNIIDQNLFDLINDMENDYLGGISFYKEIPQIFRSVSHINPNNDFFKLLEGRFPNYNNEVLLLLDNNSALDEFIADYLKIESASFNEVIGREIILDDLNLKIVGIVQGKINYFSDLNGILYNSNIFNGEITDIHLYASNYQNKQRIKEILSDYQILDEARIVVNITRTLVSGISLILIVFSAISLIVSVIMISIISYISVLERQKEIGLLKTLGTSKKDVGKLFLLENIMVGLFSSVLSLVIVSYIGKIMNSIVYKQISMQRIINLDINIVMIILFLSILLTYLAGLIPAKIASKKRIVDILYHE